MKNANDNFHFEIKKHIGVLSTSPKGWNLELNLVQWNENKPKYDLRSWDQEHKKMGKGITLTDEELKMLKEILKGVE
jgi:hypothetical protein